MENTVTSLLVAFLLIIVLVMQIQMNVLGKKIDQIGDTINAIEHEILKEKK